MGAKNHAVVLPDANPDATVAALTGAAFGAAGQRWGALLSLICKKHKRYTKHCLKLAIVCRLVN